MSQKRIQLETSEGAPRRSTKLRNSAHGMTDFELVSECLMLAEELDRVATKLDGKSTNGHA
jgi:hypothetical protein